MIAPIERGSFIITDAFSQALAFDDINITKCVPILLPIWSSTTGMFLTGTDVGLTNGTLDPNILFSNALSRYFLNLTRHASKYKFNNNISASDNFAEQSFIKFMKRVSVNNDFTLATSLPTSENQNTLIMYSNAEDLLSRKITLHVAANDMSTQPSLVSKKPIYMTTDQLPIVQQNNMINSNELALYDVGANYYDVNFSQCFSYLNTPGFNDHFSFNALLVYFEDANGYVDLGGIYFTEKFKQVGSTHWAIPTITKQTNSTFSYEINLIAQGADILEWTTLNGSLPAAFLMVEQLYQERAQLTQQVTALQGQVLTIQNQMNGLLDLLTTTSLTRFKALADTLNLVDANDKAAILQAAVSLAFNNAIQDDFIVPTTVGAYTQGQVIPAGTDINQILTNIFI